MILNVPIARKTGSGWVDTFACLFRSYSIFKLSTILLKKELKVSASSSFLVIVSSVSLLIIVMDSFWYAFSENSGFTVFQNFLLSFKILLLSSAKWFLLALRKRVTQRFRCLLYGCLDSSVLVLNSSVA